MDYSSLSKKVEAISEKGELLYKKSIQIITASQLYSGGTVASPPGRYAGKVYPRDHAYATRSFISAGLYAEAQKALTFILTCELSSDGVMFQRYNPEGKNYSNKPPQIDGNAQTLIALGEYLAATQDTSIITNHEEQIDAILRGIVHHVRYDKDRSTALLFGENAAIEFPEYERGFEIYTNAVCYRGLIYARDIYNNILKNAPKAAEIEEIKEKIKLGIEKYLYVPEMKRFISCYRSEPTPSIVQSANLKTFLALTDVDVFDPHDERIVDSLEFHLKGTENPDLYGYDRYAYEMDRHNFGTGPWPMVMIRLADYYMKAQEFEKAQTCINWVLQVAVHNEYIEYGLPEHLATKAEFDKQHSISVRMNDLVPRDERLTEYDKIKHETMYQKYGIAYAVNPLVWSHAQFILFWNRWAKELL